MKNLYLDRHAGWQRERPMKKLYLVRHAQSMGNVDSSYYFKMKDCDIPLSEHGIEQANDAAVTLDEKLGSAFSVLLVTSPYRRAQQTRDAIMKKLTLNDRRRVYSIETPLAIERIWGEELNTLYYENRHDLSKHFDFYYRPPGGESYLDCYQRVVLFFNECRRWIEETQVNNVIVVTHGEFMSVADMYLKRSLDYNLYDKHPSNCEIKEYRIDD